MSVIRGDLEEVDENQESSRMETPAISDDASLQKACLDSTGNMEYDDDLYEEVAHFLGNDSSIGCVCCAMVPIIPPWTDLKNEIFRLFRPCSILDDLNGVDNGNTASLLREVMNTVQNLDN